MAKTFKKERSSVAASLTVAILAFPVVCAVAAVVVRGVIIAIVDGITATGVQITYPFDVMLVSIMIGLPLLLAYMASRMLYTSMRWLTVEDQRYCGNCDYDLTGNVSGRCPECGQEPDRVRSADHSGSA